MFLCFFIFQPLLFRVFHLIADDPVVTDTVSVCDGVLPVELSMLKPEHDLICRAQRRRKALTGSIIASLTGTSQDSRENRPSHTVRASAAKPLVFSHENNTKIMI
jgi:hypothetical protein